MTTETKGDVERLAAAIDSLIAPGAAIEVLAEGFEWSEGPVWVEDVLAAVLAALETADD